MKISAKIILALATLISYNSLFCAEAQKPVLLETMIVCLPTGQAVTATSYLERGILAGSAFKIAGSDNDCYIIIQKGEKVTGQQLHAAIDETGTKLLPVSFIDSTLLQSGS